jgi:hypothetical protein
MIELNITGALGNQMFEYAYARALSLEYGGEPIRINTTYTIVDIIFLLLTDRKKSKGSKMEPEEYFLEYFELTGDIKTMNLLHGFFRTFVVATQHYFLQRRYDRLDIRSQRQAISSLYKESTSTGKFYLPTGFGRSFFWEHGATNRRLKALSGTFQSEKFFIHYAGQIKGELKVKTPPSAANQRMIEELRSCNSVCVHIRRGSYLILENFAKTMVVCTESYYNRAMKHIDACTKNPVFYIFSDSIAEVQNFKFDFPVNFITLDNPNYEELRLMYNCKHFVISNSSFSWWGSYLSDNPDKIVCAPSRWMNTDIANGGEDFDTYRDDMVKIATD